MDYGEGMVIQGNKTIEAETFARIEQYFTFALTLDKGKRFEWIERVLKDDLDILKEVQSLLLAHQASDTFLIKPLPLKQVIDEITERCPDLTGRRLGVYEVMRKIGSGGMGRIYSAKRIDGEYEQVVAIKVLEVSNLEIELFLKERQLLADIQHPNIVTLLDGGTLEEGFPYLVMELVDGVSIDHFVTLSGFSETEIVTLCLNLCSVVDDAHEQGIIHCDLKPDNVLVINKGGLKGTLKLLDFGIAQSLSISNTSTTSELRGITPEYASPQRHCNQPPDNTDDVFSLGVIFGQLLSDQPLSLIHKTASIKKPYQSPDISALEEHIDNKELVQILRKATAEKRAHRYASAKAFKDDLQNWLDEKPITAAQGGVVYFYSKYIYRYRNFLAIIFMFTVFAMTVGQIVGQHYEAQVSVGLREEDSREAVQDLDALLLSIPHTPSIERDVTGLMAGRFQDWLKVSPNNQTIKRLYADILVRLGNVSGHPYYLNLGNTSDARDYYKNALTLYQELEDTRLEASIQQAAKINQIFIRHRLAELKIYSHPKAVMAGWREMKQIRQRLADEKVMSFPPKQRLLVASMLLAGAYEGLRVKAYTETWDLLQQASRLLNSAHAAVKKYDDEESYLIAFSHEIRGHLYLLEGNVNGALAAYSKIIRPRSKGDVISGRYRYLLTRVDTAFACLGFQQNNAGMKPQHFKYFEHARVNLEALAAEYRDVPLLQQQIERMNTTKNVRTLRGRNAFCADPFLFVFPNSSAN